MSLYYSTFISGFSSLIEKVLMEYIPDSEIKLLLDGLVVYETSTPPSTIKTLPFFNNSFYSIDYKKGTLNLSSSIMPLSESFSTEIIKKTKTFRIIISKVNTLISIPKQQLEKLEQQFSKTLKLRVDRANPDLEVWFLERSEGYSFCGIRLTKKPSTEKYLQKGQLRAELTWLLCFLSEPSNNDIFLDPFAGFRSIPLARTTFPYAKIIASDKEGCNTQPKTKNIEWHIWDATKLPIENNSIDKIVTDPPWGIFKEKPVDTLYKSTLSEFERVLKPDGVLVLLTSQKELIEKLIADHKKTFSLEEKYNILVSGKKAGIYKMKKI